MQAEETFERELAQIGALIARRTGVALSSGEEHSVETLFKDRTGARPKVAPRPKARGRRRSLRCATHAHATRRRLGGDHRLVPPWTLKL